MSPATSASLSTLAIIAVLVALHLRSFIKGGKDPKILMSGIGGLTVGSSATICVGGALGTIAMYILGVGNTVSGVAPWLTGTGNRTLAGGSPQGGLNMEGGLVALVIAFLGWVCIRDAAKTQRLRLIGGLIAGVCLTYTGGYGGLVQETLVPLYNGIGSKAVAFIEKAA